MSRVLAGASGSVILWLAGCWAPGPHRPADCLRDLQGGDVVARVRAIKWAGEHRFSGAVPLLVDRLQEQDPLVRFYAIESLRRITGRDYGYDYKADWVRREQAVKRWRQAIKAAPAADS